MLFAVLAMANNIVSIDFGFAGIEDVSWLYSIIRFLFGVYERRKKKF